jgi:hypothetical protein
MLFYDPVVLGEPAVKVSISEPAVMVPTQPAGRETLKVTPAVFAAVKTCEAGVTTKPTPAPVGAHVIVDCVAEVKPVPFTVTVMGAEPPAVVQLYVLGTAPPAAKRAVAVIAGPVACRVLAPIASANIATITLELLILKSLSFIRFHPYS